MRQVGYILVVIMTACRVWACGLTWDFPGKYNHFDSVQEQGRVDYFVRIGEFKVGEYVIPLHLNFDSALQSSQSLMGVGWRLFPIEASFIPVDPHTFLLYQPDGLKNWFGRPKVTDTVIKGAANWVGEVREGFAQTATIWADCGWKMQFHQGKPVFLQSPKNQRVDWVYLNGKFAALRCEGTELLRVERDARSGEPTALVMMGGKRVGVEFGNRPMVAASQSGQRQILKKEERSLRRLTMTESAGSALEFIFGVNEQTQPTLMIEKEKEKRILTWNIKDGTISSDEINGEKFVYNVKQGQNPLDTAAIEKRNVRNELVGAWRVTPGRKETFENGVWTIRSAFVGGSSLAGKLRKIEQVKNGETKVSVIYQAIYDEKSHLIRETDAKGITVFQYDSNGRPLTAKRGVGFLWKRTYDDQGRLLCVQDFETNLKAEYHYTGEFAWNVSLMEKGLVSSWCYDGQEIKKMAVKK
ncbi:MAG: RHS repeat protein [Verrucomicrobiae bacterium]|nr:RHS repeat protein [Verrucomicrobiae bacterium]